MTSSSTSEGVRDIWEMACPECGSDERIEIQMHTWGELHPDGTEIDGDHEWTDESPCRCAECEHTGTVREFRTDLD